MECGGQELTILQFVAVAVAVAAVVDGGGGLARLPVWAGLALALALALALGRAGVGAAAGVGRTSHLVTAKTDCPVNGGDSDRSCRRPAAQRRGHRPRPGDVAVYRI